MREAWDILEARHSAGYDIGEEQRNVNVTADVDFHPTFLPPDSHPLVLLSGQATRQFERYREHVVSRAKGQMRKGEIFLLKHVEDLILAGARKVRRMYYRRRAIRPTNTWL